MNMHFGDFSISMDRTVRNYTGTTTYIYLYVIFNDVELFI